MMSAPTRARGAQAKRAAIHAAAQQLFTQHGFAGTSMDAIALAADVSKQTLYRYYQNKEALFIATLQQLVLDQSAQATVAQMREAPMTSLAALEQALVSWACTTLEQALQPAYLALLRVLIAEIPRFPALGALYVEAVPQQGGAMIGALLQSALRQGAIAPIDLEAAARLFAGSLLTYIIGGLFTADGVPDRPAPERVTALVRLLLQGIARHADADPTAPVRTAP